MCIRDRHNLLATVVPEDDSLLVEEEMKHERHTTMYLSLIHIWSWR